jgi:hypothetical protein
VISAQTCRLRREKILTAKYAEYANQIGTSPFSRISRISWFNLLLGFGPRISFGFRISAFGFDLCLVPIIGPVVKEFVLISAIRVKAFVMPGDLSANPPAQTGKNFNHEIRRIREPNRHFPFFAYFAYFVVQPASRFRSSDFLRISDFGLRILPVSGADHRPSV